MAKKLKDAFGCEFLAIVSMENLWIAKHTKVLLEFVGNQFRTLTGQGTQVCQSSSMILDCHYPTHEDSKGILLPQLSKINEINLEPVTKVF